MLFFSITTWKLALPLLKNGLIFFFIYFFLEIDLFSCFCQISVNCNLYQVSFPFQEIYSETILSNKIKILPFIGSKFIVTSG